MQAASSLGIGHLTLETDALKVKQAWASEQPDMLVTGCLIEELKSFTTANFISCECVHVLRGCNKQLMFLLLLVWVALKRWSIYRAMSRIVLM